MVNINIIAFLEQNFKELLYIIGAIFAFLMGRKSRKLTDKGKEVSIMTGELENVEVALKIYRVMLTDLQDQLKKAEEAYDVIEKRLQNSIENNRKLVKENQELKEKIKWMQQ